MVEPEIVVDLGAIAHNVRTLAALVAPAELLVVVKADGYGHGVAEVAATARAAGAPWLGVATAAEALALRAAGDRGRLLCWLTGPATDWAGLAAEDVDVTLYSTDELAALLDALPPDAPPARVQVKVDTGLSRGGAAPADWEALFAAVADARDAGRVELTGLWSHFACSDEPDHPANDAQQEAFERAVAAARAAGLEPGLRHLANSAAAILRPRSRLDLVRCGIASYGLDPAPGQAATAALGLRPAMTVRAPLALTKAILAGDGVSYGHTWVAPEPTTVGLVPVGYADGIPRHASDRGEVWVDGARRPVRGRVCMDQFVVDLGGDLPPAGAEATIFGPGVSGEPTAQDWAEAAGTINYEIVTRIGGRLRRRHLDAGAAPGSEHEA